MALFLSSPHNVSNAHRRSTPRGNTIRQTDCVSGRDVKGQSEAVWVRSRPRAVLRTKQVLTVWIQPGVTSQRSLPLSLCHSPVTSSSPLSLFLFHLLLFTSFLPHLNFQSLRFLIAARWSFSLVDVMFAPAKKKAEFQCDPVSENKAKNLTFDVFCGKGWKIQDDVRLSWHETGNWWKPNWWPHPQRPAPPPPLIPTASTATKVPFWNLLFFVSFLFSGKKLTWENEMLFVWCLEKFIFL